jgi:hypothetical protein
MFGLTVEIFFTTFVDAIENQKISLQSKGYSYICMFPLYGIIAFIYPVVWEIIKYHHSVVRYLEYATLMILFELTIAYLFEKFTGTIPWEYEVKNYRIEKYTKLSYFPFWGVFGLMIEKVFFVL